ncbi:transcription factor ast-1-like [Cherax quadricarinatus]|uniref:transcription factor ast-1-like n=1 Tax=Cherax quadricarinatus TaxID=27406 RepID=UPI002379016F|nr:uncharacterized protein LOC128692514 [Cherax quadricarinatus]
MDNSSYEDLRASFTLEEPLFGHDASIDSLCQTYLGNLNTFSTLETHNTTGLLDEIETFSKIDIGDWRGEDCLDWAGSVCKRRGLDQTTLDLWELRSTCGSNLLLYSCQDFCRLLGTVYGPLFYQEFCQLKEDRYTGGRKQQQQQLTLEGVGASSYSDYSWGSISGYEGSISSCEGSSGGYEGSRSSYEGSSGGYEGNCDTTSTDCWTLTTDDMKDLDRYIGTGDSCDPSAWGLQEMDLFEQSVPIYCDSQSLPPEPVTEMTVTGDSTPVLSNDPLKKIRPHAKKRERGPKNWEFVIRLLADPQTNPSLIRWEEQAQGTFRLVQPSVIARMWGQRADKPNLSYDNFARGLRYHYTTGALQPVSEKQLVYRCGPKAIKYLIELKTKSSA